MTFDSSTVKPTTLLFFASLLANIALVAVLATRPSAPPSLPVMAAASGTAAVQTAVTDGALRAALVSGNPSALEAAGVDPSLAREIALGRTFSRLVAQARAEQAAQTDNRWWRNNPGSALSREQQLLLRREMSDALGAAFGDAAATEMTPTLRHPIPSPAAWPGAAGWRG